MGKLEGCVLLEVHEEALLVLETVFENNSHRTEHGEVKDMDIYSGGRADI